VVELAEARVELMLAAQGKTSPPEMIEAYNAIIGGGTDGTAVGHGHGGFSNRQCAPPHISCEARGQNLGGLRMVQCSGARRCFRALRDSGASQVLAASFMRGV
jgi:hypothetical protein